MTSPVDISEGAAALKPCPFCGGADIREYTHDGIQFMQCNDCTSCGPDHKAGRHWNVRHDALSEAEEKLASLETRHGEHLEAWRVNSAESAERESALQAQVEELQSEVNDYRNTRRWNIKEDGADLLVCKGDHEKYEGCEHVRYVPESTVEALRADAERLTSCLQLIMADLTALLDADHFNNIESRVLDAGVSYPPIGTDPRAVIDAVREGK